jgi:RNA polymerase sigma-70 factor (ECF subfamily)
LLSSLYPTEPEVFGLLALMLLQQSRAPARFDANGDVVLLDEQDRSRWKRARIEDGRTRRAGTGRLGVLAVAGGL